MTHLALAVLFFYPAYTTSGQIIRMVVVALMLLMIDASKPRKMEAPAMLLLAWFLAACFCSYVGSSFNMSLFGYYKRWEGLPTWGLAIAFGYLFWKSSKLNHLFITCVALLTVCLCIMLFQPNIFQNVIYGHITISAFVTVVACMLMAKNPAYCLAALPFALLTQQRCMLIGIGLAWLAYIGLNFRNKHLFKIVSFIALATVVCMTAVLAPKLSKLDLSTLGRGARVNMLHQTVDLFTLRPFTGYGIGTLSLVLKQPKGELAETFDHKLSSGKIIKIDKTLDKSHNFFCDILLQTGLLGLVLWLFILTRMVYLTYIFPSQTNVACLLGMAGFIGFSMLNPSGIPAMFMACLCVMGIEKQTK